MQKYLNIKTVCFARETYPFVNNLKFWTRRGSLQPFDKLYPLLAVHPQQITSESVVLRIKCGLKIPVLGTFAQLSWRSIEKMFKLLKKCKAIGKWKLSKKKKKNVCLFQPPEATQASVRLNVRQLYVTGIVGRLKVKPKRPPEGKQST